MPGGDNERAVMGFEIIIGGGEGISDDR